MVEAASLGQVVFDQLVRKRELGPTMSRLAPHAYGLTESREHTPGQTLNMERCSAHRSNMTDRCRSMKVTTLTETCHFELLNSELS
jgi:hypothetical protein